jgi:hypothetical protein
MESSRVKYDYDLSGGQTRMKLIELLSISDYFVHLYSAASKSPPLP